MNPILEHGEMVLTDTNSGVDYFLRPSFSRLSRIGSPSDIVMTYSVLNGYEVVESINRLATAYGPVRDWVLANIRKSLYGRKILSAAMNVIHSCCDEDVTPLVGEWRPGNKGVVYRHGAMSPIEVIIIARELAEHGVMGKAKVRKLQRYESAGEYSKEFHTAEYINAARIHFSMPRDEAEELTMTEYQLLMHAKYPQKQGLTRDEYDSVTDNYLKKKAARIAKNGG